MAIKQNITSLQNLLEQVNSLPDAGGVELPALSNPAIADEVFSGKQLVDGDGEVITGTFTIDNELIVQNDLILQIQAAVDNLPEVDSDGSSSFEICTVQVQPDEFAVPSISKITYTDVEFNPKTLEGLGSFSVPKNTIILIDGWSRNSSVSGATELLYVYGYAVYRITDNAVFIISD